MPKSHEELARAAGSLGADARKVGNVIGGAWKFRSVLIALASGGAVSGAFWLFIADTVFTGVEATLAAGALTAMGFLLLLGARAIHHRDVGSMSRATGLLKMQEDYWTVDNAAVVDVDVRRIGLDCPKVRVWVSNRGPDAFIVDRCDFMLVTEPWRGELRAREAAPLSSGQVESGARKCVFEIPLTGIAAGQRFRLENVQTYIRFPHRAARGPFSKHNMLMQPFEVESAETSSTPQGATVDPRIVGG